MDNGHAQRMYLTLTLAQWRALPAFPRWQHAQVPHHRGPRESGPGPSGLATNSISLSFL